jgi:hypothetical protein
LDKKAAKDVMRSGHLSHLVYQQIRGRPVKIDVWNVHVTTHDHGFVKPVSRKETAENLRTEFHQKLLNNCAIGAQCYVGGDAERLRTKHRVTNIASYTVQTIKWGLFKSFSSVTSMIDRIEQDGEIIAYLDSAKYRKRRLSFSKPISIASFSDRNDQHDPTSVDDNVDKPHMPQQPKTRPVLIRKNAIELVFQNIPSLWGRMLNLWNRAETGSAIEEGSLHDQSLISDSVDHSKWHTQTSYDGEFELFILENKLSYVKKELAINRTKLSRIGHFKQARIVFRDLNEDRNSFLIPKRMRSSLYNSKKDSSTDMFRESRKDCVRIMIDGEFFIVRRPKYIDISFWKQINVMGPPEEDEAQNPELED